MKRIAAFLLFSFLIVACTSSKNSPEFIAKTQGRYLFNSDESIKIYFTDAQMRVSWRNQDMIPIKANDSSFYLKEMNEKLVFVSHPKTHIELAPKREHNGKTYHFIKLKKGTKTPSEYLESGEYEKALEGYLIIQKNDSLDRSIKQRLLNRKGYDYLNNNELDKAEAIFNINIALYPKSSNTYDSMGDLYRKKKDTTKAIEFYKKALAINPENRSSKRRLKQLTNKK